MFFYLKSIAAAAIIITVLLAFCKEIEDGKVWEAFEGAMCLAVGWLVVESFIFLYHAIGF